MPYRSMRAPSFSPSWLLAFGLSSATACSSASPATTAASASASASDTNAIAHAGPVPDGGAVTLATELRLADVAILFPLATSADEADAGYLSASSVGARGVLLPEAVAPSLNGGGGGPGGGNPGGAATSYAQLRVVALRVDPCFAALAPPASGAGCANQLRLVFQPLSSDGSSATDAAIHVFYSLTRAELVAATKSLVALRLAQQDDTDTPSALAPHAIMAKQGLTGQMSAGVRAVILAYAGASNLTRVTHFTVNGPDDQWTFGGFDVTNADLATATQTAMQIPTVSATSQTFKGHANGAIDGTANPATTSADDLMPFTNLAAAAALTSSARQADYDSLLRVENPADNSSNTIDCVSCHAATPARKLVAEAMYGLSASGNANAFVPDGTVVTSAEAVATVDATQVNLHAFSYAKTHAAISQRTVNEAAAVVEYLVANGD